MERDDRIVRNEAPNVANVESVDEVQQVVPEVFWLGSDEHPYMCNGAVIP